MKKLLCLLLLSLAAPAFAQNAPFIAVKGQATVDVVPDVFPLDIDIHAEGMDVAKAQARVEELTRAVIAQARSLGLQDKDIYVGSIGISPQTRYDDKTDKSVFTGNKYTREIGLTFTDLDKLRQQVAATPPGENVEVNTQAFRLAGANEARRKLLIDAIANARSSAEVLAAGVGRRLGPVQTISTSPLSLSGGSYINPIDVASVESTTILTAEQIERIPVPRNVTSVALLGKGSVNRADIQLEKGSVRLSSEVYIVYTLQD